MEAQNKQGKFIVFEGTDGSGKSTQMTRLSKYLKERGVSCFLTHEPTDAPIGAVLRACLSGRLQTDERAIALLFASDRLDHIHNPVNGLKKKLSEGITVLCDRYYLSSFAYNGGFADPEWVIGLNKYAMEELRPDLTVYIDLPPEEGMERVLKRGEADRYETLERQKKIRDGYFEMFRRFPEENVAIIKSEKDKALTEAHIQKAVNALFGW